jgi:cephalosporin hydroxylase
MAEALSAIPYDLLMSIQGGTMVWRHRGLPTLKNPFDLALYPLLLAEIRPRTLIEIGSHAGGSALWFADTAAALGIELAVHSVDLIRPSDVTDARVTFHSGNGRDLGATFSDAFLASLPKPWLVVEDADHHYETTLAALRFFDRWVAPGDYVVVEDGILSDMRVAADYGGGPARATADFLAQHAHGRYEVDRGYCDYFGRNVTWNVDGWLRLVA